MVKHSLIPGPCQGQGQGTMRPKPSLRDLGLVLSPPCSVKHISCSLLILHAEDDPVVPFHLGKKVGISVALVWAGIQQAHVGPGWAQVGVERVLLLPVWCQLMPSTRRNRKNVPVQEL